MWKRFGGIGLLLAFGTVPVVALGGAHAWKGHQPPASEAEVREKLGSVADRVLARVDATDAQQASVDAVIDRVAGDLWAFHGSKDERHAAFREALTAETVDRKALESVRKDLVDDLDAVSEAVVEAIADVADVLTPAQRREIAAIHDEMRERGGE